MKRNNPSSGFIALKTIVISKLNCLCSKQLEVIKLAKNIYLKKKITQRRKKSEKMSFILCLHNEVIRRL